MDTRTLGRTGRAVSVIGMGCWQIGGGWGEEVAEEQALDVLRAAREAGTTFFDTADVYGDGRSERLVGRLLAEPGSDGLVVATKMGRRADPHVPGAFTLDAFRAWNDRSRENLGVDTLDLVQLHCPPTPVYATQQVFEDLETMVQEKRIAAYGVSVETVAEAMTALQQPNLASIQIIFNVFRRKPLAEVLPAAAEAGVGIIARVPLASGLLTGRYDRDTRFADDDHRTFNRHGEQFDQGETFSGVPYEVGVDAAQQVAATTPEGVSTAQFALRWVVDQPGVSVVIPGARTVQQAEDNAAAGSVTELDAGAQDALRGIYDDQIARHVEDRW